MYVLDEPSIGLHQRDNDRLLETLKRLRDFGNSVIVVEHDEDAILKRRLCVRYGPRRGCARRQNRRARYAGANFAKPASLTGQFLERQTKITMPKKRTKPDKKSIYHRPARPATI